MAKRCHEPHWLSRVVIDAIHTDQLREHGGLPGIRDENVLASTLARPQQTWHYEAETDVPMLAAAHAVGLVKGRPYRDGNKRIGFLAMAAEFRALAEGSVAENELAYWIREHVAKRS